MKKAPAPDNAEEVDYLLGSSSLDELCGRHDCSRSKLQDLINRGLGPKLMRIGAKVRVSHEAEREWIKMLEERGDPEAAEMLRRKAIAAAEKAVQSPLHVSNLHRDAEPPRRPAKATRGRVPEEA
jgi:hypothetical protein